MITSNVKQLMEKRGISIRTLSAMSLLSDKTILRARGPQIIQCRLQTLGTIADCLECRIKDLFSE